MLDAKELRSIAEFVERTADLFEAMVKAPGLEILFDDDVIGSYLINRKDGTPLGKVQITDAGGYEFVPGGRDE